MIAGKRRHFAALHHVADFECRLPHADAKPLGLVAARYHTPVVVAQHNHRATLKLTVQGPFAAYKEIVAVCQSCHSQFITTVPMPCSTTYVRANWRMKFSVA